MGQVKDSYFWGYYPEDTESYTTPHVCSFPDTGLYLSWCRCGREGYYSFKLGKYLMYKD